MQDDSNRLPVNTKLLTRFFEKIRIDPNVTFNGTPCWLWTRSLDRDGYARFWYEIQSRAAHTRKTHCLRGHKFTVENTRHNYQGGRICRLCIKAKFQPAPPKTHCRNGHPYERPKGRRGERRCVICNRQSSLRSYHKLKGAA